MQQFHQSLPRALMCITTLLLCFLPSFLPSFPRPLPLLGECPFRAPVCWCCVDRCLEVGCGLIAGRLLPSYGVNCSHPPTHPPTHHLDTIGHCYLDEAKRSYYCNNLTFSNLDLPEFCSPGVFCKLVITDRKTDFWSPVWLVVF